MFGFTIRNVLWLTGVVAIFAAQRCCRALSWASLRIVDALDKDRSATVYNPILEGISFIH